MNKKLEQAFADRGWLHRSLVNMKRQNEEKIATKKNIDVEMFELVIGEIIWTNKMINIKIVIEMCAW